MKSISINTRRHDITFHASGKIDISARIVRRLNLAPGDVIDIAAEGRELYLYVRLRAGKYAGRHSGSVWATAQGKGTFRTCSKTLAAYVLQKAGKMRKLRCPCGDEITLQNKQYITIIYQCQL